MKICSGCKLEKDNSDFYKDKSQSTGLSYRCKTCSKSKSLTYYAKVANTTLFKKKRKNYRKSYYVDNKDQVLASCKVYRDTHKEKKRASDRIWRQNNPKKSAEYTKRYRAKNKHKVRAWDAKRRADELKQTPTYANLSKIEDFYKNCPPGMEVDHIIPLRGKTICGFHIETNLQYLLKSENRKKSNKFSGERT